MFLKVLQAQNLIDETEEKQNYDKRVLIFKI